MGVISTPEFAALINNPKQMTFKQKSSILCIKPHFSLSQGAGVTPSLKKPQRSLKKFRALSAWHKHLVTFKLSPTLGKNYLYAPVIIPFMSFVRKKIHFALNRFLIVLQMVYLY